MRVDEVIDELKCLKYKTKQEKTLVALSEAIEMLENMPLSNMEAEYQSFNGYYGKFYGESSMAIYDKNKMLRLHTGFRTPNTYKELKAHVDSFPKFLELFAEVDEEGL